MGQAYQRGAILYRQKRYAQAADEFRRELSGTPNSAPAQAMLALSMLGLKEYKAAEATAKTALGLSSDYAFAHYAMATVLINKPQQKAKSFQWHTAGSAIVGNYKRARRCMIDALRLEPRNPGFLSFQGSIESALGRHSHGLKYVDQALAVDPNHVWSIHMRQHILLKMGRVSEAQQAGNLALEINPEHAPTHNKQGWTLLHAGEAKQAMGHFVEALRLNPNDEDARKGLVEAAKSRNALYRIVLRLALRTNRYRRTVRLGAIMVIFAARACLAASGDRLPTSLQQWILISIGTLIAAGLFAFPVFNLVLLSDPVARQAMQRHQRVSANVWVAAVFLLVAGMIAYLAIGRNAAIGTIVSLATLPAIAGTLAFAPGRERRRMGWMIGVTAMLGVALLYLTLTSSTELSRDEKTAYMTLLSWYLFGCVFTVLLLLRQEKR